MKIQFLCLWMAVVGGVAMCFGQTSSTTPENVPANEQAIIDLEKVVTKAYKNKKADVFRKYLAKNYVGINADGTTKRTSEITEMQNTDLRNYSFTEANADELAEIGKLIDEKKIKVIVSQTFPFSDAAKAQEQVATGHTRGKVVLKVADKQK